MKKFIALAIAVVMLAALAVPAFAAPKEEGSIQVSYTVGETYVVTLPGDLTVGKAAGSLKVTEYNLYGGNKLVITATSANSWKLNGTVPYELNDTTFEFTANGTEEVSASWAEGTTVPTVAGNYVDTVTFSSEIVPVTPAA